jgi:C-terminal processing protease CtpA/Prc
MRKVLALALIASATLLCGSAPAMSENTRPLTGRGADNLTAFARLLSYVRFFHPSDEAASADWNRVAVAGIEAVEEAADPASLARALEGFFRPVAPTVRVFPEGQRPEIPRALRTPAGASPSRIVAWRHYGGQLDATVRTFYSARIDNLTPSFGTLVQAVAPGDLRGRRVLLRARVRAEMKPEGRFQLGLRVDLPGGRPGFLDNMADRPLRTTDWRTVDIKGEVAPDAERIVVLAVLTGEGRVWLDEVSLGPVEGKGGKLLANPGFDEGEPGTEPPGWYFPYEESIRTGYHLELRRGEPCLQGGCVELFSDELAALPQLPRPEEVLAVSLGGGISALLPTTLYADARGTLPRPGAGSPPPSWSGADPLPDTRNNRLAALLLAWGILAHFHPTLDIPADDWAAALRSTLPEAAAAGDREAYRRAVLRLLTLVRDPVANDYTHREDPELRRPPLEWEWIEDHLVITAAPRGNPAIRRGDVVLEIDGKPAGESLAATEAIVSAATPPARRALALIYLSAGPPESSVSLRLEHPGEPATAVTLKREERGGTPLDLPPPITEPRRGILCVDLKRLDDAELERQLSRLAAARGVVFDLRGFTRVSAGLLLSHLTSRRLDTLTWQIPVYQQPDRQRLLFLHSVTRIEPRAPRITARIAFLADARTFQNSERMLETIAAYSLGEIVGADTAGNVGNPNWSDLPGGWTVTWTGRRGLKHDGKTLLNGTGVQPTVPAARTLRGIAEGRDEVLERAVEIVSR